MRNSNEYVTCESCGEHIAREEAVEIDGHYVCDDCESYTYICESCGSLDDERCGCTQTADHNCVCDDCISRYYTLCDHCGEYVPTECAQSAYRYNTHRIVCDECADNFYVECSECGDLHHEYDIVCDDNGNYLCPNCHDEYQDKKEVINDYGYKPEPEFFDTPADTITPLYMGVELEVDDGQDKYDCAGRIDDQYGDVVYLKHDGSLNDGFEIVTHPCTLNYHKQVWEGITGVAKRHGFLSHDARTCGLHVHMSRQYFGDDIVTQNYNIGKLILLMNKHWDNMVKFSRRTDSQLGSWAKRVELEATKTETPITMDIKVKEKRGDRYVAVNLNNKSTVELRIFNGTLRTESLLATLEFCQNLADAAIDWTIEEVNHSSFGCIVEENPTEYLVDYCKSRGIDLNDNGIDVIKKCHSRIGNYGESVRIGNLVHLSPESELARQSEWLYRSTDGWFRITNIGMPSLLAGVAAESFFDYTPTNHHLNRSDIDMVVQEDDAQRLRVLERFVDLYNF